MRFLENNIPLWAAISNGSINNTKKETKQMDDQQQIENVINIYIDSMNESNADMVRDAFHENAKITG